MAITQASHQGSIVALWRYPVKSMLGEEFNTAEVTERGLLGDRAYALIDEATGKVVSAKNPRKWGNMFEFRAAFIEPPRPSGPMPAVRIRLPNGETVATDGPGVAERVTAQLARPVRLASSVPDSPHIEGYSPDYEWLPNPDEVFEVGLPTGTFFDVGLVHLVTTATLDRLRALGPQSRFDPRRFRPNIIIATAEGVEGFVENEWIGRTVALGDEARLRITQPTARCVMTTLSQGDLPKDPNVLRTAVQHNQGNVGVYAAVVRGGPIHCGDFVVVE
jgi:uncharacterized protein YcbX